MTYEECSHGEHACCASRVECGEQGVMVLLAVTLSDLKGLFQLFEVR